MFKLITLIISVMNIFAFQASAGCGRWVIHERADFDYLADPAFDAAFNDTVINPSEKSNEIANANVQPNIISQPLNDNKKLVDLSGKWQVNTDKPANYLKLILIQSNDKLQGYGNLVDNNKEFPATATGSISNNVVVLDTKMVMESIPKRDDKEYKLDLTLSREIMSGSYELYEANKLIEKGNATAIKI